MQATISNVVDYQTKESLHWLVNAMDQRLSDQQKLRLQLFLIREGMMQVPWFMRVARKLIGTDKFLQVLVHMCHQDAKLLSNLWRESTAHIVSGHDLVDPRSAGGFNGEEMRKLTGALERMNFQPSNVHVIEALNRGWFQDSDSATALVLKREFHLS